MTPETVDWLCGLREYAALEPVRTCASPAEEAAERAILAAHLVAWLDTEWDELLATRLAADGCEPALVITTSPAGRAAAREILDRSDPRLARWRLQTACVSERAYRLWCIRHPDPDYRLHVNHWNWIKTRVPERRRHAFVRWPLAAGECHWLHRTGTSGAGTERRVCHLWKWNGRHAALVQPVVDADVPGL